MAKSPIKSSLSNETLEMAKAVLLDQRKPPKVKGYTPFGSQIMVELLEPGECIGSGLVLSSKADLGARQCYVLAIGPSLKPEDIGLKVGDRIVLSGGFTPLLNYNNHPRERGLIEIHSIKAIVQEA